MAITFDTIGSAQADGLAIGTVAMTIGNISNGLLVVKSHCEDNDAPTNRPVTSVGWVTSGGSQSLTLGTFVQFTSPGGEDDRTELWYLLSPTVGAGSAIVNYTGAVDGFVIAAESYAGVAQSSQPNVVGTAATTGTGPIQASVNTTVDDCVLLGVAQTISSARTITAASGQTQTYNIANTGQLKAAGGYEVLGAAGAQTESWTVDASADWLLVLGAFSPAVEVGVTQTGYKTLLGVGI